MEDAAKANSVFENLVDLHYGVVSFVVAAVGDVVDMEYYLRHPQFSAFVPLRFNSKTLLAAEISLYLRVESDEMIEVQQ